MMGLCEYCDESSDSVRGKVTNQLSSRGKRTARRCHDVWDCSSTGTIDSNPERRMAVDSNLSRSVKSDALQRRADD